MSEFYFPASVGVQDETITLVDDQTFVFQPQFARGFRQTNNMGGPRFRLKRRCFVSGDDRSALLGFLASVRGKQNPFWSNINYKIRGSFPAPELFANADFGNGTTSWSVANGTLTARRNVAHATITSGAALMSISQSLTLSASNSYMVRGAVRSAKQNSMGAFCTAGDYAESTARISTQFGAGSGSAASIYPAVFNSGGASELVAGDYGECAYATCQRIALVNGANQSGSTLIIDGLPNSTAGLALVGDIIEVNRQLVMLVTDLNSDGSGNGLLRFEPELVGSPANNDAVVFGSPMGKFALIGDPVITNQYGLYATVDMEMEQVY